MEVWFSEDFFVNVWFGSHFFVNVWFSSDFLVDVWFSWYFEVKVWVSSWVNLSGVVVWVGISVTKVSWSGKTSSGISYSWGSSNSWSSSEGSGISVSTISVSSWGSNSASGISQTSGGVVTGLGGGYQTGKYSNKSLHDEYDELQMLFENR